jgi:CheY-like chemotaxis protein
MTSEENTTVLIVDDEEDVARTYETYLKDDYKTQVATNGGEAFVELSPDVDVVLLDRRMPGMKGDEVLRHIHQWGSSCRVIIVSAVDPDIELIDTHFSQYLKKPVRKEELHEAIESVLLVDQYEDLVEKHYDAVERYSVLQDIFTRAELEESDEFLELKEEISDLRKEINTTVERFSSEEMTDLLGVSGELQ